jgi:hypothetical protein
MDLMVLNYFFTILHLFIILFNLFGWAFPKLKKLHFAFAMLTLASWLILGIWKGIGYCPITDWHWAIKEKLGEHGLPNSFIKYIVDQVFSVNSNSQAIDICTVLGFSVAIACSIKVNFISKRTKHQ